MKIAIRVKPLHPRDFFNRDGITFGKDKETIIEIDKISPALQSELNLPNTPLVIREVREEIISEEPIVEDKPAEEIEDTEAVADIPKKRGCPKRRR